MHRQRCRKCTARNLLCLGWVGLLASGCVTTTKVHKEQSPPPPPLSFDKVNKMLDPDVVAVAAVYDSFDPWMWDESHERPCGIVVPGLYLMGTKSKSVFGDGTIRPRLYVQEINEKGESNWKLAKQWTLSVEEAMQFRSRRQTLIGWGYRLHLPWDELSQLSGKQIRMVVEFERKDGTRLASTKKDFRVPAPSAS
jgi:hypothetical protein